MTAVFFLRYIAPVLAVLAVVGVIYGKGRLDANHANEVRTLETNLEIARTNLAIEKTARNADLILAVEASEREAKLVAKTEGLEAYVDTLEANDRACFSKPDVDQLRKLWN